jgi:23S rRNA pseudouridine2605 synthase
MSDKNISLDAQEGEQRIAKYLARAGVASRRQAEELIAQGRVKVNGETVTHPSRQVSPGDKILVDNKPIQIQKTRVWLFHKPRGVLTTHSDDQGRKTVLDLLPKGMPHVSTVGRLDYNTEGLLLITNDGEFARQLELPSSNIARVYRVRVYSDISNIGETIKKMAKECCAGPTIEGVRLKPVLIRLTGKPGLNIWLEFTLREGKNREIRNILEHYGFKISRLIRVSYGPFQLNDLKPGELKEAKIPKSLA